MITIMLILIVIWEKKLDIFLISSALAFYVFVAWWIGGAP